MKIFNVFVEDANYPNCYSHGKVIDPLAGKIYLRQSKTNLSTHALKLRLRG